MFKNKSFILGLIYLLSVAVVFWMTSRYPALSAKLSNMNSIDLFGIGFDLNFVIVDTMPFYIKAIYTAGNWIFTNMQGMTFGILFGAGVITTLKTIDIRPSSSNIKNAIKAMFVGASLGVCSNCATPISESFRKSNFPKAFYIPLLMASPILNPIVLTISFSLLPVEFVGLRLWMLFVIVMGVVLLAKDKFEPNEHKKIVLVKDFLIMLPMDLIKYAGKIIPLMIFAGILGSVIILLLPEDLIFSEVNLAIIPLIALISTALPVPITFDVFFTSMMISAGVPLTYAMVFNLSMAIFSIYPFMVIYKSGFKKMAYGLLFGISIITVITTYAYDSIFKQEIKDTSRINQIHTGLVNEFGKLSTDDFTIENVARTMMGSGEFSKYGEVGGVGGKRVMPGEKKMMKAEIDIEEYKLGFDNYLIDLIPAGMYKFGVATIDYNNDGWIDIFIANTTGTPIIMKNVGGERFVDVSSSVLNMIGLDNIMGGYPYDYDNDHDMDILVLKRFGKPILLENNDGIFRAIKIDIGGKNAEHYSTATFGDLNQDGVLEAFIGSFSNNTGWYNYNFAHPNLLKRKGWILRKNLKAENIKISKNSNVSIMTDINNDTFVDLCLGNDLMKDECYLNNGTGQLLDRVMIEKSPSDTMSMDTAYINSNNKVSMFIAGWSLVDKSECATEPSDFCLEKRKAITAIANMKVNECDGVVNDSLYYMCVSIVGRNLRWGSKGEINFSDFEREILESGGLELPSTVVDNFNVHGINVEGYKMINDYRGNDYVIYKKINKNTYKVYLIEEKSSVNMYNVKNIIDYGVYDDLLRLRVQDDIDGEDRVADSYRNPGSVLISGGVLNGERKRFDDGLAWTTKFIDIDNDGDEDIYGVNGAYATSSQLETNRLYENIKGKFVHKPSARYETDLPANSLAIADFNNDGNVDLLVGNTVNKPHIVMGGHNMNNFIHLEIHSKKHNSYGIGAKVRVTSDNIVQVKEMNIGGGFLSASHPRLYFGLGKDKNIDSIEVIIDGKTYIFKDLDINKTHLLKLEGNRR
jgi:uncharacterized membrane protein YraQ (UPF0718 family)